MASEREGETHENILIERAQRLLEKAASSALAEAQRVTQLPPRDAFIGVFASKWISGEAYSEALDWHQRVKEIGAH